VELRGAEKYALLVSHNNLCAGRIARIRARSRNSTGSPGSQAPRRGVPAETSSVSAALNGRNCPSQLPSVRVSAQVPLRRASRALDYFRNTGTEANGCMLDVVQIIRQKQQPDARSLLDHAYDEALAVSFGEVAGAPSRWNTLRALRVLGLVWAMRRLVDPSIRGHAARKHEAQCLQ